MRVNVVVAKIAVGLQQRNGMRIILVQLGQNWSKKGKNGPTMARLWSRSKVQGQPCRNHDRDPIFRCSLCGDLWGGVGESVRLPFTVNQMSLLLLFLGSWIMHASPPNILTQILTLTRSLISWNQNVFLNMAFAKGPMLMMKQLKYLLLWSDPGPWKDQHLVPQRWKHEPCVRGIFLSCAEMVQMVKRVNCEQVW